MNTENIVHGFPEVAECRIEVRRKTGSGQAGSLEASFRPHEVPVRWPCPNSMCGGWGPGTSFPAASLLGNLFRTMVATRKGWDEGRWHCPARETGNGPSCREGLIYPIEVSYVQPRVSH